MVKKTRSHPDTKNNSDKIDILIRGGTLVDGTGSAPITGDVAIAGNTIVEVGGKINAQDA
jgi:N-acyl-D-aspartate/D-glutamate deacylase